MKRSDLSEFEVEEQGFKLKIKRGPENVPVVYQGRPAVSVPAGDDEDETPVPAAQPAPATPPGDEAGVTFIKSPMVGTFYRASSPESKPFAENGTKVTETSVVCIIEAMKIMNEIQAETKGTIVEILVENGQPVEYGQRLFKVKQG